MAATEIIPDVEGPARDWVKALNIAPLGDKVYITAPTPTAPAIWCKVQSIDHRVDEYVPLDAALIQVDVIADGSGERDGRKRRREVKQIANRIASEIRAIEFGTVFPGGLVVHDSTLTFGPQDRSDTNRMETRFVFGAELTLLLAAL